MTLTVAFLPVYQNPYQHLLTAALRAQGIDVLHLASLPAAAWLVRERHRVRVLHLHWLYGLYMRHTLTPLKLAGFLGRLALARRLGYRLVWTAHNILPHRQPFPPLHRFVRRYVIKRADAIIAHCEYGRREIWRRFGPGCPIQVIPHGNYAGVHDVSMTRAEARRSLHIEPDRFVYLLLGNISAYKGIESFVDAFQSNATVEDVAVIAGRNRAPALVSDLELRAAEDDRLRVHAGFIPDDEMPRYLRAADVAVFCFEQVLTSGSVILAMTYGLPVLCPALGCLPELVTPASGLLYDASDPGALGRALRHVKTLDTAAMGLAAQAVAQSLCWHDIARQTADVYRSVVGAQADGRAGRS